MYGIPSASGYEGGVSQKVYCWSIPCRIEPILDLYVEGSIHLDNGDLTSAIGYNFNSTPVRFHLAGWAITQEEVWRQLLPESLTLRLFVRLLVRKYRRSSAGSRSSGFISGPNIDFVAGTTSNDACDSMAHHRRVRARPYEPCNPSSCATVVRGPLPAVTHNILYILSGLPKILKVSTSGYSVPKYNSWYSATTQAYRHRPFSTTLDIQNPSSGPPYRRRKI